MEKNRKNTINFRRKLGIFQKSFPLAGTEKNANGSAKHAPKALSEPESENMKQSSNVEALHRRNLKIQTSTQEAIDQLRVQLEATSDSEVVRLALRALDQFFEDDARKRELTVRRQDGTEEKVLFLNIREFFQESASSVKRNMKLNDAAIERINKMKKRSGITSDSEIIRKAVNYLIFLKSEEEKGAEFVIREGFDENKVRMPLIGAVPMMKVA